MLLLCVSQTVSQFVSQLGASGDYTEPTRAHAIIRPTNGERNAVMRPDSLLSLVQALRERIGEHHSALSSNEMLTRYALVDPLLYELGWDTSNPNIVVPEDTSGRNSGRPDYVLRSNGQPAMVVEAKKLGSPEFKNSSTQAFQYAQDRGRQAQYFATTDGQRWEVYDLKKPFDEIKVVSFDLMMESPAEVCLKAMALWRPAVEHSSVMVAETPIVGLDAVQQDATEPVDSLIHEPEPIPQGQPAIRETPVAVTQSGETSRKWIPLSELTPEPRSKPAELLFPDNMPKEITSWASLTTEIVGWLLNKHHMHPRHYPIQFGERYIISDKPIHPSGSKFKQPKRVENVYVEMNYSGRNQARNSRIIVEYTGLNPAQFKVRLR